MPALVPNAGLGAFRRTLLALSLAACFPSAESVSQCPDHPTGACAAPPWAPVYDMSASTYAYCFGNCPLPWLQNHTSLGVWRGLAGVDHYYTGQGMPCVNGQPQEFAAQDRFAVAVKAWSPAARVLLYRITDAVPYDPVVHAAIVQHPEWFVRWANGSVCQMPYEEHGTGRPGDDCDWPIIASAYDYSNAAVREWYVQNIIAPTLVHADGVWLDGDGPDNGAWMCSGSYDYFPTNKLPAPYPPLNDSAIDAFCEGEAAVVNATNEYVLSRGGFNYECLNFVSSQSQLPVAGDSAAACNAKVAALVARAQEPTVLYGDRTHGQHYTDANVTAALAVFYVTRGAHWYFGLPSANTLAESSAAQFLAEFGAPSGPATQSGATWTREFEGATVALDCDGVTGTITPK